MTGGMDERTRKHRRNASYSRQSLSNFVSPAFGYLSAGCIIVGTHVCGPQGPANGFSESMCDLYRSSVTCQIIIHQARDELTLSWFPS